MRNGCMCVCEYVCMCVCVCLYIVCTNTHTHTYTHIVPHANLGLHLACLPSSPLRVSLSFKGMFLLKIWYIHIYIRIHNEFFHDMAHMRKTQKEYRPCCVWMYMYAILYVYIYVCIYIQYIPIQDMTCNWEAHEEYCPYYV